LFYVSLGQARRAMAGGTGRDFLLLGLGLGITFLGHAAPALLLGGILVVCGMREMARPASTARPAKVFGRYASTFAVALGVSAPFLASIVGRYHMHVRNAAPTSYSPAALNPH